MNEFERFANAPDDVGLSVRCGHTDDDPAEPCQRLTAADVLCVLPALEAMLLAVILDGDHEVLPSHVEVVQRGSPFSGQYGNLGRGPRQPRADQQQSQPRLFRRLRSGIGQLQRCLELPESPRAAMVVRDFEDLVCLGGLSRSHQGVQMCDRLRHRLATTDVGCRALRRRHGNPRDYLDLVGKKREVVGSQASRRPRIRAHQLDGQLVVHPFRAVPGRRG
jgi:hypothetical protein